MTIHALIVEDEQAICDLIQTVLTQDNVISDYALSYQAALTKLEENVPDILILDWMLPGKSGIDLIRYIRQKSHLRHIPILMLTAKAEESDLVKALECGADDYLSKPFSPRELLARLQALLRRGPLISPGGLVRIGDLIIDSHHQTVGNDAQQIVALRPNEFKLLQCLVKNKGRVLSRQQILDLVWGKNVYPDDRTVDVQIKRLRQSLDAIGCKHYVKTVRSLGYMLNEK